MTRGQALSIMRAAANAGEVEVSRHASERMSERHIRPADLANAVRLVKTAVEQRRNLRWRGGFHVQVLRTHS